MKNRPLMNLGIFDRSLLFWKCKAGHCWVRSFLRLEMKCRSMLNLEMEVGHYWATPEFGKRKKILKLKTAPSFSENRKYTNSESYNGKQAAFGSGNRREATPETGSKPLHSLRRRSWSPQILRFGLGSRPLLRLELRSRQVFRLGMGYMPFLILKIVCRPLLSLEDCN